MRPAGVSENVAVSAQPPSLDSRQTSVTTTIDTERIEELPVRSRNFLEFVLLAPVSPVLPVTRHLDAPSSPCRIAASASADCARAATP